MQEVVPQWRDAMEKANATRFGRAEVKRQVRMGEKKIYEILEDQPECVKTMTLYDLVIAQHRWGASRTRSVFITLGCRETKKIGTLTPRQIEEIVRYFRYIEGSW